jgi:hypothetical protein
VLHAFLPNPDAGGPIPTGIISTGAQYNANPDTTSSRCLIDYISRSDVETPKTHGTINRYVRVGGWEKVSTPAGTFDAIKLGVVMHLDDGEFWRGATTCTYSVWYAPAVRNVVREERNADYVEKSEGDSIRTQHALLQLSDFTPGSR